MNVFKKLFNVFKSKPAESVTGIFMITKVEDTPRFGEDAQSFKVSHITGLTSEDFQKFNTSPHFTLVNLMTCFLEGDFVQITFYSNHSGKKVKRIKARLELNGPNQFGEMSYRPVS
jgi:hypothetical protein